MPREALGEFEHHVLLAILRKGSKSYSVELVLELEERTGREVATAAVYVALLRLEKRGLLKSAVVQPGEHGGHARRYFHLTAEATKSLQGSRQALFSLWDGVESELDEA